MSPGDLQKLEEQRQKLASATIELLGQLNEVDKTTSRLRNEGTALLRRLVTDWPTKPEFQERVIEAIIDELNTGVRLRGILNG